MCSVIQENQYEKYLLRLVISSINIFLYVYLSTEWVDLVVEGMESSAFSIRKSDPKVGDGGVGIGEVGFGAPWVVVLGRVVLGWSRWVGIGDGV